MKAYTFNEVSDILDGVNCVEDIKAVEDYLYSHLIHYTKSDVILIFKSLEVLKMIWA